MASLGEFAQRIRTRGRKAAEKVDERVRKTALVIARELVLSTPVDTSRARSNWVVGLGGAETAEVPASSAGATISAAESEIARRKAGQDIYISNNVPYIGRLNDGSSAQAPAQFVEQAIQRGVTSGRDTRIVD